MCGAAAVRGEGLGEFVGGAFGVGVWGVVDFCEPKLVLDVERYDHNREDLRLGIVRLPRNLISGWRPFHNAWVARIVSGMW